MKIFFGNRGGPTQNHVLATSPAPRIMLSFYTREHRFGSDANRFMEMKIASECIKRDKRELKRS